MRLDACAPFEELRSSIAAGSVLAPSHEADGAGDVEPHPIGVGQ